ncbi:hypothetical protein E3N88_37026 [Mikania micrantha]|uniref:CCHC-type domain-containing protein n=1 Tax=Mikania micrantha TaxID=192012 RepID=A0A5N6M6G5_9ASTR|nr:hypothetical protein E3N88_37026 [Mikania micrantha]
MAEDGKFSIEKFDGSDFSWWKMQMDALLCQKDLDMVLNEKPEKMEKAAEALWDAKDKKAKGIITLSLTRNIAFNIMSETTARGMMVALSNMYEKPSAANKVFLMRELFTMRMREGSSVTEHINNLNSILSRLSSVGMKFDDETKAVLLLSSLPDSWSGTVTAVTNSVGTDGLTLEKIRNLVLGEDVRRRGAKAGSSSEMFYVGRGRENSRDSGSSKGRGRSSSKARPSVRCWECNEKGHYRGTCPNKNSGGGSKNSGGLNTAEVSYSDDDALILCSESSVESWVMDFGASFHATHSNDGMRNVKEGDFGKVRLGNGEVLDVTGMGDLDLVTTLEEDGLLKKKMNSQRKS